MFAKKEKLTLYVWNPPEIVELKIIAIYAPDCWVKTGKQALIGKDVSIAAPPLVINEEPNVSAI